MGNGLVGIACALMVFGCLWVGITSKDSVLIGAGVIAAQLNLIALIVNSKK